MITTERAVYATQPRPLRDQINRLLRKATPEPVEGEILALIVPDTNLLSGGEMAAEVYRTLQGRAYDTVILVSPSHTGPFGRIHICREDTYRTPLGELVVNDRLRNELCDEDDDIFLDDTGHFHTEGVDVQLPFLQTLLGHFDVVPVVMGEETPDLCRELGHAIGEVMYHRRVLVVVSANIGRGSSEALERIRRHVEEGDVSRLISLLNSDAVEIVGRGPIAVALIAALHRDASNIRVLGPEAPTPDGPGSLGAVLSRS